MSRILLVDDDEDLLTIAEQFLVQEDPTFNLFTALSAQIGLQKLKEEPFDVVVADYVMPEMDGLEFLKTLRDEGNEIAFIMFTGQGREEVAMQALNLGADYYIMKGGEPKSMYGELAHSIRQLVQFKRTEEELLASEEKVKEHSERLETILEKLKENMERLHSFMDSSTEAFTIFDSEMRILEINKAGLEMWPEGTRKEELIGKSLPELIPGAEKSERYDKYLEVIRSGTSFTVEGQTSHPLFGDKRFTVRGFRVGDGLGVVTTDITEQKQVLEKLQESEENYRNLTELHFDGVAIHERGTFLDINAAGAQMLGYKQEDLIGTSIFEIVRPESHEIVRQSMIEGLDRPFEVVGIKKDGESVHVELVVGNCTY